MLIISSSGYDVQVVGDFLPQLNCGICMMIIKNAMNGCTKHVFCEACIKKQVQSGIKIDGNVMCPGGCGKIINASKLEPNEFVDRLVNCLTTKCSNNDCNWQGDLLDLVQVHQRNCEFILQSCDIKGCNEKYVKKDVLQHGEDCLFKLIECTYCETDIIRMNMKAHVVECLNVQVKCIYYDIGCKNDLCRRDICSHEEIYQVKHMGLIYQDSLISKNEVASLKKEIFVIKEENTIIKEVCSTMKKEISVIMQKNSSLKEASAKMKQEYETLKDKLIQIESKSTQEVFHPKLEVKNLTKDLKEFKEENLKLIETTKKFDINISNEVVETNNGALCMKLSDGVNHIDSLKQRLNLIKSLYEKVSLVNNDNVMIIRGIKRTGLNELSKCYDQNDFNDIFDTFGLNDHKNIMVELLNKVSYHLYDAYLCGCQYYWFVFPHDLKNIKDTEVLLPHMFRMNILNNEIIVEILDQRIRYTYLYIENYATKLESGRKLHHNHIFYHKLPGGSFPCGYAFLYLL